MPDNKKDLLDELKEAGLDDDWIDRIRDWNAASPLRKAAKSAEDRAREAEEKYARLHKVAINAAFKEAGIRVNPALLSLPDDLDITDQQAFNKWAIDNGLRDSNSTNVENEQELRSHEEVNEIAAGGDNPSSSIITPLQASEWPMDRSMKFAKSHPEAWELLKRGEEVRNVSTNASPNNSHT